MKHLASTSLRSRLTLVLALGSIVLVAVLIGGFNLVLQSQIRSDLNTRLKERASAASVNVIVRDGRVRVREAPNDRAIDQQIWVFAGGSLVESAPEPPKATAAALAAAARPGSFAGSGELDLRFYAQPVRRRGRTIATVVAGTSLEPYETTTRRALVPSIFLGITIIASVLAAVRFSITAALRPVGRMTSEAAAWSVDDLDKRFGDLGTHDEIARLGSTFNDLLARLAASFRHEQRFSAELSHELRTPLAKLIIESELALRRERTPDEYRTALGSIVTDARQMQGVIDTLLAVSRSEINTRSGTADASDVATSVVRSLTPPTASGLSIDVHSEDRPLRVGVDAELAERVLAPVVANALQFANHHAAVQICAVDSAVEFRVSDDGPGVPPEEREAVFQPGFRGTSASSAPGAGSGLGLALARRLARAADGDVVCRGDGAGGAFVVSLPLA